MKNRKKDIINIIIIISFILLYVLITTHFFNFTYGSTTDWDCQHWNIPEYFRNLFYNSNKLLFDFAPNIGDGQNIYYLSYYGYLSPIVLISFLLPFVPMKLYIEIISIIGLILSACIFYYWIRKKYDYKISLIISLAFAASSPLLFHSHRHIMFISYMPFLLLCFNEIDNNFKQKKPIINYKLILFLFLVIMSNYFFAVSALFSVGIYELYKIVNKYKIKNKKEIRKELLLFIISCSIALLMASVLLIPTLFVLLNGRAKSNVDISILSLILPTINIEKIFYSPYSAGISFFVFLAALYNIKSKEYRIISIFLTISSIFPIVSYLLNGTMYVDYKVFIPLLPLFMLLLASFVKNIDELTKNNKKTNLFIIAIIILTIILNINKLSVIIVLIEIAIFAFVIKSKSKEKFVYYPIIIIAILMASLNTNNDKLMKKDTINLMDEASIPIQKNEYNYRTTTNTMILQNINNIKNLDYNIGSIYSSVENKYYRDYYYNFGVEISQRSYGKISNSSNPLFNIVNGNRYLISNKKELGYDTLDNFNKSYENTNVLTIARSNLKKMNIDTYNKLEYPYNMEALTGYVISDDKNEDSFESNIKEYNNIIIDEKSNVHEYYQIKNNRYTISNKKKKTREFKIENVDDSTIVFISFDVKENDNNKDDIRIKINGISNVASVKTWKYHNKNDTFHYAITNSKGIIKINFGIGEYEISNIRIHILDYNDLLESISSINCIDLMIEEKNKNTITGNYFSDKEDIIYLQIPYDNGFQIKNNGKLVNYFMINNGMIGFKADKGTNNFEIIFKAPLLNISKGLSSVGFIAFIVTIFLSKKKKKLLIIKKK